MANSRAVRPGEAQFFEQLIRRLGQHNEAIQSLGETLDRGGGVLAFIAVVGATKRLSVLRLNCSTRRRV